MTLQIAVAAPAMLERRPCTPAVGRVLGVESLLLVAAAAPVDAGVTGLLIAEIVLCVCQSNQTEGRGENHCQ